MPLDPRPWIRCKHIREDFINCFHFSRSILMYFVQKTTRFPCIFYFEPSKSTRVCFVVSIDAFNRFLEPKCSSTYFQTSQNGIKKTWKTNYKIKFTRRSQKKANIYLEYISKYTLENRLIHNSKVSVCAMSCHNFYQAISPSQNEFLCIPFQNFVYSCRPFGLVCRWIHT